MRRFPPRFDDLSLADVAWFRFMQPDPAVLEEVARKDEEAITSMISVAATLNFGADSATTTQLRRTCQVC